TMSGMRGCAAYQRSNSERLSVDAACATALALAPSAIAFSRANSATAEPAPTRNTTMTAIATGVTKEVFTSRKNRFGKVVIGNDVAAPDTMNRPTTATSAVKHSGQYTFSTANET